MHQTDILEAIMRTPAAQTNYYQSTEFGTTPDHEKKFEDRSDGNPFSPFPNPPTVRLDLNKT